MKWRHTNLLGDELDTARQGTVLANLPDMRSEIFKLEDWNNYLNFLDAVPSVAL